MTDSAPQETQEYSSKRIFVAPSVTQAMHAVRREMGDHAVIVQVRRSVDEDGLVEVVASDSVEKSNLAEVVVPDKVHMDVMQTLALLLAEYFTPILQPRLLQTAERLQAENSYTNAEDILAAVLEQEIPRLNLLDPASPKLPMLFFGPSGMGKTSTVMKFALHYRLEEQSVRLFNLDAKRIGNRYTIGNFAKLTDAKAHHVRSESVQKKISETEGTFDLIDTAPINPFDGAELKALLSGFSDMAMYRLLVVSQACDSSLQRLMLDEFAKQSHIDGIIVTGLDIFPDYARLLNLLLESGLPVAGISRSAEIAAGAAMPSGTELVQSLLA